MALKQKLTRAEFDKLAPALQAEYKADGENYVLDVEGAEDVGALRRAKDREVQEKNAAKDEAARLKAELDAIKAADTDDAATKARKAGDIATLEKSWKEQREAAEGLLNGKLTKREKFIETQLVDTVAHQLATELSTAPAVLLPHIKARLSADLTGDTPITRVLDKDGKISALTVADLKKEFVANTEFAAIIIASKGSGGGASGGRQGDNGGNAKKFADMTGAERVEYQKRDPAGFEKEAQAARAAGPSI